jgi:hypothetical protein
MVQYYEIDIQWIVTLWTRSCRKMMVKQKQESKTLNPKNLNSQEKMGQYYEIDVQWIVTLVRKMIHSGILDGCMITRR